MTEQIRMPQSRLISVHCPQSTPSACDDKLRQDCTEEFQHSKKAITAVFDVRVLEFLPWGIVQFGYAELALYKLFYLILLLFHHTQLKAQSI
jgi:hypothetical protein